MDCKIFKLNRYTLQTVKIPKTRVVIDNKTKALSLWGVSGGGIVRRSVADKTTPAVNNAVCPTCDQIKKAFGKLFTLRF
jgi:hypothetical protein